MSNNANNLRGLCEVNDVVLSNMSRYLLANHPETLSKNELRKAKKHLKDCLTCQAKISEETTGK